MEEDHSNRFSDSKDFKKTLPYLDLESKENSISLQRKEETFKRCYDISRRGEMSLLHAWDKERLRIPLIRLAYCQRDKRQLPFEAKLLNFMAKLPRQMTRGPFIFGQGNILERIDEKPLEEVFDENSKEHDKDNNEENNQGNDKDNNQDCSRGFSEVSLHASGLSMTVEQSSSEQEPSYLGLIPNRNEVLTPIPEATWLEERDLTYTLNNSQRRVISSEKEWLQAISEVERSDELDEEESDDDDDEIDERLWFSNSNTSYFD